MACTSQVHRFTLQRAPPCCWLLCSALCTESCWLFAASVNYAHIRTLIRASSAAYFDRRTKIQRLQQGLATRKNFDDMKSNSVTHRLISSRHLCGIAQPLRNYPTASLCYYHCRGTWRWPIRTLTMATLAAAVLSCNSHSSAASDPNSGGTTACGNDASVVRRPSARVVGGTSMSRSAVNEWIATYSARRADFYLEEASLMLDIALTQVKCLLHTMRVIPVSFVSEHALLANNSKLIRSLQ